MAMKAIPDTKGSASGYNKWSAQNATNPKILEHRKNGNTVNMQITPGGYAFMADVPRQ